MFVSASGSSRRRRRCPWPDLPSELLGLVLLRLTSHADRVRLRAVCRAWRSSARLHHPLPALLPWVGLPDGTFLSLPDEATYRFPVPFDVSTRVSTGGALFLVHDHGGCSVTGPSPAAAMTRAALCFRTRPWRPRGDRSIRKVVVSDHLVAGIESGGHNNVVISTHDDGGLSGDISTAASEWAPPAGRVTVDIAIFRGKLYVLTAGPHKCQRDLFVLDVGDMLTTFFCCIPSDHDDHDDHMDMQLQPRYYLVVSGDRLLAVKRMINSATRFIYDDRMQIPIIPRCMRTIGFEVFEGVDLGGGCGYWQEVDSLMGKALFVSRGSCESLPPAAAGDGCDGIGVREDCIYFLNENDGYTSLSKKKIYENSFLDSGLYDMRSGTITPLPQKKAVVARDGPYSPTWLFPET